MFKGKPVKTQKGTGFQRIIFGIPSLTILLIMLVFFNKYFTSQHHFTLVVLFIRIHKSHAQSLTLLSAEQWQQERKQP